jgi:hypothetical protein
MKLQDKILILNSKKTKFFNKFRAIAIKIRIIKLFLRYNHMY